MKILLVSMNSVHFVRWTEQLKDSGHEVYWFDILDSGYANKLSWVNQIVGWKQKYPNLKGRHFVKKRLPWLYKKINFLFENDTAKAFEETINKVQPDVVHSIVLYLSCTPILSVMKKHEDLQWIYSSWGSDLFYFRNIPKFERDIKSVLPRVNYLITDCKRDVVIAKELGFVGKLLGTFPGGGGFNLSETERFIVTPTSERRTIMVKGYQGRSGRGLVVLKALIQLKKQLKNYKILVFGADSEVLKFSRKSNLEDELNISIYSRAKFLPHKEILKLMGEALIYIGNSNSDGMPNTLLEAITMGAFPIQSNPGGATEEVITHNENGMLINDCENVEEIKGHVISALSNSKLIEKAFIINQMEVKPQFARELISKQVLTAYNKTILK